MQAKEKVFKLVWESGATKQSFSTSTKFRGPLTKYDHDKFAKSLSFNQIAQATEFVENNEIRRKHKWKEMRNFVVVISSSPKYEKKSMENALYLNNDHKITGHHFIMSLMSEYQFENSLNFDCHLQYIYWSFDGGRQNDVDWRDILATYYILKYFRYIRDRTLDLILLLFDIYTAGDPSGRSLNKGEYILDNADVFIRRIFILPCILDAEVYAVDVMLVELLETLRKQNNRIKHRDFEKLMRNYDPQLLKSFSRWAWDRLSVDMRLIVLDEAQLLHRDNAEHILYRYKLLQALAQYHRTISRRVFIEWKLLMLRESGVRIYTNKRLYRKRMRMMKFWHFYTCRKQVRRRRRMLAEVIGSYASKARIFARIQLFNYNNRRLKKIVGSFDRKGRLEKLGGTHLRQFKRLFNMRTYYHRWWNQCVAEINNEACERHNRERILKGSLMPWYRWAHELAVQKRNERITEENKLKFDRMMEDAEKDTQMLIQLELDRKEKQRLQDAAIKEADRIARLEAAKLRAQKEKDDDRNLLLTMQRDLRMKRISKELKKMKTDFKKEWETKTQILLEKARSRITAYVENPTNELAIQMRFEVLRKEFYAPPTPESQEREKKLSSPKNILMLFISAKLARDKLQLSEIIPQFDKHGKGYLTYTEFSEMIRFVGAALNPAQISSAIREIDEDGDGFVELKELEQALHDTKVMGVLGSVWKLYIDPAEDVICYHNMTTGERLFEYQMRDKKLKEINLANMYGEAEEAAMQSSFVTKKAEWELTLQNYMARRMQYMYKLKRARQWRAKKIWKVDKRNLKIKTDLQRTCVRFLERTFIGFKSRDLFRKQLRLTIEKIWDVESGRLFWFNHHTQDSSWEMPHLLRRFGDVTTPTPWVPVPRPVEETQSASETMYKIHYWHVTARKDLPRKPDGLPVCSACCRNLAVHSCNTCEGLNFCWTCHRESHASPLGFFQKTKASRVQYSDPVFLEKLAKSHHVYGPSKPLRCQMCNANHMCAGVHCNTCEKDMCRPCSRRIHGHASKEAHEFYEI